MNMNSNIAAVPPPFKHSQFLIFPYFFLMWSLGSPENWPFIREEHVTPSVTICQEAWERELPLLKVA